MMYTLRGLLLFSVLFLSADLRSSNVATTDYAGQYKGIGSAVISQARIHPSRQGLQAYAEGISIDLLATRQPDKFVSHPYEASITFIRNARQQVVQMHVQCNDPELDFYMQKLP